jgi:NAD(P)-dependent dehydrogenase (short-subunit alcohol dehydrogenase family)
MRELLSKNHFSIVYTNLYHALSKDLIQYTASTEEFDRMLNINVKTVFLSYKYAAAQMIKQGRGGRIIGEYSTHF